MIENPLFTSKKQKRFRLKNSFTLICYSLLFIFLSHFQSYANNVPEHIATVNKNTEKILPNVLQNSTKQISGKIVDEKGEALIGVNISVKGTSLGTISDIDGNFIINVQPDAVLIVSYVGYLSQEVGTSNKTMVKIVLKEDVKSLDEFVVIGYGAVKKSDLTGSVQKVDSKILKNQTGTQISEMLAGSVAGFNGVQGSSAKGGGSIEIRGRTSLNASTEPMIVLDGAIFNGSMLDINPQDVESIEILKDASSAAIYGARASNGVIMVSTKKGEKGKPMIAFSAQIGSASPTNMYK